MTTRDAYIFIFDSFFTNPHFYHATDAWIDWWLCEDPAARTAVAAELANTGTTVLDFEPIYAPHDDAGGPQ